MAKTIQVHDGTTKPIVELDTTYPGGHRLVVHDDAGGGGGGGDASEATLATRLSESDFDTKVGSLTEAEPASDTASSGLNGRLQRIAQRLTSLIGLLPAALVGGRLDVNIGASPATVPVSLQTTLSEANDSVTGHIGGYSTVVDATITRPANTTQYTSGDEVGTLQTFAAGRSNGASGIVTGASVIYSNNPAATPTLELYLFDATITTAGDNGVWAPSDADLALSIGCITLSAPKVGTTGASGNLLYSSDPVSLPFVCAGGSTSLFGLLVTRTTFTPIANSETLKIRLRVERN